MLKRNRLVGELTTENLASHNNLPTPENTPTIAHAKNFLIQEVRKALWNEYIRNKSKKRYVYKTDRVFELLQNTKSYARMREIAYGQTEQDYQGSRCRVIQYKHNNELITIVMEASWGSCSGCDMDLCLEEEIMHEKNATVFKMLAKDAENKINRMSFYVDFEKALMHIRHINSNNSRFTVKFNKSRNSKRSNNTELRDEVDEGITNDANENPEPVFPVPVLTLSEFLELKQRKCT